MGRVSRSFTAGVGSMLLLVGLAAPAASAAPPGNDDLAAATVVGTLPFSDSLSTVDATVEAQDPIGCIGAAHSVWYAYTADLDGLVAFETYGSDFDTVLSAYTGTQGSLTPVACNDDTQTLQSHIKFAVSTGTTYFIMVSGYGSASEGASGNLVLAAHTEPPFTMAVTTDGRGSVDESTGRASIRGTLVCSTPGVVYIAQGRLRQRNELTKAQAYLSGSFSCGTEPSVWEAPARPRFGRDFVRGKARLVDLIWRGYSADYSEEREQVDAPMTIRLRR